MANVLRILNEHFGRPLYRKRMWNALYADREDGGPSTNIITVYIHRWRRIFSEQNIPLTILSVGWKYADEGMAYKLVRISEDGQQPIQTPQHP